MLRFLWRWGWLTAVVAAGAGLTGQIRGGELVPALIAIAIVMLGVTAISMEADHGRS